jgi:beta-lactamase class A
VTRRLNRRAALGLGAAATAGLALGPAGAARAQGAGAGTDPRTGSVRTLVARVYRRETRRAGGTWNALITVPDADGGLVPAVDEGSGALVEAYSVNKVAVATAVLDKVDRGLLSVEQRVDVTAEIVRGIDDGIFTHDGAYPSAVTLGHVLAALLTVSDDAAVRLCGLVCPAREINEILVAKGFPNTQVQPVANPNRFFLGRTTARETHDLLQALVRGTLLSASSTARLLGLIRSPIAFTDGIRRTMSSDERARVATKAGWFADGRNEAGIMFDRAGSPVLTYALFARGQAGADNFGATHPAVQARAVMGRAFLDAIDNVPGLPGASWRARPYQPSNGG